MYEKECDLILKTIYSLQYEQGMIVPYVTIKQLREDGHKHNVDLAILIERFPYCKKINT